MYVRRASAMLYLTLRTFGRTLLQTPVWDDPYMVRTVSEAKRFWLSPGGVSLCSAMQGSRDPFKTRETGWSRCLLQHIGAPRGAYRFVLDCKSVSCGTKSNCNRRFTHSEVPRCLDTRPPPPTMAVQYRRVRRSSMSS